jgi:hypothetical protein
MNSIGRERERSLKFVQIVFAVLALLSLVAALAVSTRGSFLLISVIDTVLLFAWEHIFHRIEL